MHPARTVGPNPPSLPQLGLLSYRVKTGGRGEKFMMLFSKIIVVYPNISNLSAKE